MEDTKACLFKYKKQRAEEEIKLLGQVAKMNTEAEQVI